MHTSGPWKVEEKRSFHNWNFFPISATSVDTSSSIPRLQWEIATAGQEEDAHLIAAAPELLEALKGILEIGKRDLSNPKYDGYFATAQAAIDKAEGRI
jgi:hypothetical protein